MHDTQPSPCDPEWVFFLQAFQELFAAATRRLGAEQSVPGLEMEVINPLLGHEVRACRHVEGWSVFLQLTPWMLCRVLVPGKPPHDTVAQAWEQVSLPTLGPRVSLTMLGQDQDAHVQYDPQLGSFYLQPLVVGLSRYQTADQVFSAWTDVVQFRENVRRERSMTCRWQQDLTRREIFGSFRLTKGSRTEGGLS
ncbi:MAG: [NiFe]-hydrogenase assembly chaperone HybE [Magnetococcales bacterium]|nr:[NiFe]-hydrogenase assembly chaperone HybE [Magnetococcales bacterium]